MAPHSSSSIDAGRNLKRRKTRKGTRSCWACKRRKVKCTYASTTDDVCSGCARRCLDCVGQEFPEQDPGPSSKSRLVGDRISRLESMIQQLAEQVGGHVASSSSSSPPASISIPVPLSITRSKHRTLSQTLLAAYPSTSDLRIIGSTGENLALYLPQAFVAPTHLLEKGVALESEKLWGAQQQQYTADTNPVLIARQMLQLAGVLQHLHAAGSARSSNSSSYQKLGELSRPPRALARRLAEAATTLVTAHDGFTTKTLEGLECLWLEALYYERNGSPRQSWLAYRRAISAVHLMGFHGRRYTPMAPPKSILQQPDGEAVDLQQIWLRLVHSELALCLALEMPPSASFPEDIFTSVADSVTTEDNTTGTSKLERRHAAIASHLLERSERDPDFDDLDAAHQIRTELEEAMNAMPSGWWRTPSLADHARHEADDDKHLFGTLMKLRTQILHFYLLLVANLPSMLQATCGQPTITTTTTTNGHRHNHSHNRTRNRNHLLGSSRKICIDASRDLLRRFIHLRSCERTAGYFRLLDHYAWQAAATLLISRLLDGCQTMTTTSLGGRDHQQHLSDRTMVSEAMERMRLAGDEKDDGDEDLYYCSAAAAKSDTEDVLPRLLGLDASGVAVVVTYCKPGGAFLGGNSAVLPVEDQDNLVLPIPFVGRVSIAPQVQYGNSVKGDCSLISRTVGYFPIVQDDEAGPQGSDADGEEEEEEDEASLTKAVKLRRSLTWLIAPYILRA
ncbi:C6 zinc finger domain containing protein [Pleurostoma richardsiae]|uniref:C6 zinc finger domain containing protein n=1 Tax=Pleurostoma richardsiae TaxID=41990 RepID=A0AA38RD47_9PEZI|nr:C6 zinc finger domain containing protein [Pleurostoma richardsiae]